MLKPYAKYKETPALWLNSIPDHWESHKIRELFVERSEKVSDKDYSPLSVSKAGVVPQIATVAKTNNGDNRKLVRKGDFVINSRSDRRGSSGISNYDGSVSLINIVLKPRSFVNGRYMHYLLKSHYFIEEFYRNGRGIVADLWTTRYTEMKSIYLPVPSIEEQDQIVRFHDWKLAKINKLIRAKKKQIVLLNEQKQVIINNAVTKGLDPNVPMKDSGIEWIGQIPIHWNVIRLRGILSPVSIKNHPKLPLLSVVREKGVIVRDVKDKESNHNFIPDDLSGYKVVQAGQFVMNKMKAWQGSYGISPYTGIVSPAYFVFDVNVKNKDYFHYSIRSKVYVNFFAQASNGIRVGQWDLNISKMKDIPFIVPSEEEQTLIIDYIKRTSKDIEVAITRFSNEIKLLQEYRTRLISDVVTGKVDVRDIEIPEYEADSDETIDDEIDDNLVLDEEDGEMEVE
jgi:type I restriction enzyme S subunit